MREVDASAGMFPVLDATFGTSNTVALLERSNCHFPPNSRRNEDVDEGSIADGRIGCRFVLCQFLFVDGGDASQERLGKARQGRRVSRQGPQSRRWQRQLHVPRFDTAEEMKSEEYAKKAEAGTAGIITVFGNVNMGRNLGLTFLYSSSVVSALPI